jgi:hypothetical protein
MNPKMQEHLGEHADKYPKALEEKFPHVFLKLVELWGTAQMRPYLDELIMSNRPNRQGFPADVVSEIWSINRIYSIQHPEQEPDVGINIFGDVWGDDIDVARDNWKQQQTHKH